MKLRLIRGHSVRSLSSPSHTVTDTVSMLLYTQPVPSSAQHVSSSCCHMPCLFAARQAAQRHTALRHSAAVSSAPLSGVHGWY